MLVKVCQWKSCSAKFSKYIITRLENDTKFYDWKDVDIKESLCMWECKKSPNVMIDKETHNYAWPAWVSELVCKKIREKEKVKNNKNSKKKDCSRYTSGSGDLDTWEF